MGEVPVLLWPSVTLFDCVGLLEASRQFASCGEGSGFWQWRIHSRFRSDFAPPLGRWSDPGAPFVNICTCIVLDEAKTQPS
jgi:hypothetical protein